MSFSAIGKEVRLSKIINPQDGRAVIVAADHGFMLGVIPGVEDLEYTLQRIIKGHPDGILLSRGQATRLHHLFSPKTAPALLLRSDWSNWGRDKTYTLPLRRVERIGITDSLNAISLGASGVVVYYFLGYGEESKEAAHIESLAAFARGCNHVGIPFIVEPVPFGERITGSNFAELVKVAVRIAVEVGADAIKTPYTGDPETFKEVVDSAEGTPILILGGAKAKTIRDAIEIVAESLEVGGSGVVFGRQIVQATDPTAFLTVMNTLIHKGKSISEALHSSFSGPVKIQVNRNKCIGCHTCEAICTQHHHQNYLPSKARLHVDFTPPKTYTPMVCTLCGFCVQECPPGALEFDSERHYVHLIAQKCSKCKKCLEVCPVKVIRWDSQTDLPLICNMCQGAPQCAEWCPTESLKTISYTRG
jgi:fructose-bisphosphate aldolase/2-amino-3,7-dideoxy-D-threo-hept-6-ulosonate synthase